MTRRMDTALAVAARPLSGLVSAVFLLLGVVLGGGGFAIAGGGAGAPAASTVAAGSTSSTRVAADRRAAPVLGTLGSRQQISGWAPQHPEPADVVATEWQLPTGFVALSILAESAKFVSTVQVSHRGRAPPAGSLLV